MRRRTTSLGQVRRLRRRPPRPSPRRTKVTLMVRFLRTMRWGPPCRIRLRMWLVVRLLRPMTGVILPTTISPSILTTLTGHHTRLTMPIRLIDTRLGLLPIGIHTLITLLGELKLLLCRPTPSMRCRTTDTRSSVITRSVNASSGRERGRLIPGPGALGPGFILLLLPSRPLATIVTLATLVTTATRVRSATCASPAKPARFATRATMVARALIRPGFST